MMWTMLESEVEDMKEFAAAIQAASIRTAESAKLIGEQFKSVLRKLEE